VAVYAIDEWDQELDIDEANLLVDEPVDEYGALSDLVYRYRDGVSPDALN
jgi:hypothetical protein